MAVNPKIVKVDEGWSNKIDKEKPPELYGWTVFVSPHLTLTVLRTKDFMDENDIPEEEAPKELLNSKYVLLMSTEGGYDDEESWEEYSEVDDEAEILPIGELYIKNLNKLKKIVREFKVENRNKYKWEEAWGRYGY